MPARSSRTQVEIIYDILNVCRSPKRFNHILLEADINSAVLYKKIDLLMALNQIEVVSIVETHNRRATLHYTLTPEGVKSVGRMEELFPELVQTHSLLESPLVIEAHRQEA